MNHINRQQSGDEPRRSFTVLRGGQMIQTPEVAEICHLGVQQNSNEGYALEVWSRISVSCDTEMRDTLTCELEAIKLKVQQSSKPLKIKSISVVHKDTTMAELTEWLRDNEKIRTRIVDYLFDHESGPKQKNQVNVLLRALANDLASLKTRLEQDQQTKRKLLDDFLMNPRW